MLESSSRVVCPLEGKGVGDAAVLKNWKGLPCSLIGGGGESLSNNVSSAGPWYPVLLFVMPVRTESYAVSLLISSSSAELNTLPSDSDPGRLEFMSEQAAECERLEPEVNDRYDGGVGRDGEC